jgi:hypothetical protein
MILRAESRTSTDCPIAGTAEVCRPHLVPIRENSVAHYFLDSPPRAMLHPAADRPDEAKILAGKLANWKPIPIGLL